MNSGEWMSQSELKWNEKYTGGNQQISDAEEWISYLEDEAMEIAPSEQQKEKINFNEDS